MRITPNPEDQVFYGTLGPRTNGCLDINDTDAPCAHICNGAPGLMAVPSEERDAESGPPDAQWEVGNQVRMVRSAPPGGPYPSCSRLTDPEEPWSGENFTVSIDSTLPHFAWEGLTPEFPQASFQWKGTTSELSFSCPACGLSCTIQADFLYHAICSRCHTGYSVDFHVPVKRIR